jgi:hypothetical protein
MLHWRRAAFGCESEQDGEQHNADTGVYGGASAPIQNQRGSRGKQPCSRRRQSSHGVISLAISDIGERCEAEGI